VADLRSGKEPSMFDLAQPFHLLAWIWALAFDPVAALTPEATVAASTVAQPPQPELGCIAGPETDPDGCHGG
jgi:hypothetical protein